MRIAVLSDGYPPWERGGAQKIAAQCARGYAARDHDVTAVTTVPDRDDVGTATVEGVRVRRLWCPRTRTVLPYLTLHNPLAVRRCRRALERFDPDVVHAHNVHYLSNGCLRAAADIAPVVKTFHDAGTVSYGELTKVTEATADGDAAAVTDGGGAVTDGGGAVTDGEGAVTDGEGAVTDDGGTAIEEGGDRPAAEPLPPDAYRVSPRRQLREEGPRYLPIRNARNRRCLARRVDRGVAVSRALRRALVANGVRCADVIRNGVDAEAVAADADPAAVRRAWSLGDDPVVLFGGRTGYNKGGTHLAAAFGRVAEDVPDARLVVTGDDGHVPRMREAAAPHGDRVTATGWVPRERLRGALAAATVVATPSVFLDPFPTVNLEAFAAGTPVVTTRFGGAPELVDGETGAVVDPTDVGALADALRRFLASRERAAAAGRAGRRRVERDFTVEGQVDAYLERLEALHGDDGP